VSGDPFIAFSPPSIGAAEIAAAVEALESGWVTAGPRVVEFESSFRTWAGADAAVALSSATAGLHLALVALGIGPGDVVLTTPMTFCSALHVIEHVGATPLLVDVDRRTLNIDPDGLAAAADAARGAARAVLAVHLHGHPFDLLAVHEIARRHDLGIVEDAAHAIPTRIGGNLVGSAAGADGHRQLTAFSFYATKNLTTGEGGMLTGPAELVEDARARSLHGMSKDAWRRNEPGGAWRYDVARYGFKYNMTDPAAAMGLVQLARLEQMHRRRTAIANRYDGALRSLDGVETPSVCPGAEPSWHIYSLRLRLDRLRIDRDRFIAELAARGVGTSVHFIPVPMFTYFRDRYGWRPEDCPVALEQFRRLVSLPIHPELRDTEVDRVIDAVVDTCGRFGL
jgi:dTDP-4-amino-4,6-dideoxygalactose transaminase